MILMIVGTGLFRNPARRKPAPGTDTERMCRRCGDERFTLRVWPQVSTDPKYTVNVPSAFSFALEELTMLLSLFMKPSLPYTVMDQVDVKFGFVARHRGVWPDGRLHKYPRDTFTAAIHINK